MPEIWMDVDAALASVPVNSMPLIDDTDFKTIEAAVVFNQSGLALFWNFTTTAGTTTVTAVTPTSAGDYDWTDFTTSGKYGIEIPASGGASANNDTEGVGYFTGVATGILPWRGPSIGFRAAALNNALIDGGDTLDVNVTAIAANAITETAINADAITAAKIADNALANEHFANGALTSTEITSAAGCVVSSTGLDAVVVDSTFLTAVEDQVWDAALTGASHNDSTSAGRRLRQIDAAFVVTEGTADAGSTSTTINLETGVADGTTDNIYSGDRVLITAGTGAGEHGLILSYASSTQIATMSKAWVVTPDATSEYILVPADCDVELWNDNSVTGDGDWAELQTDVDNILVDTAEIGTAGAGLTNLGASGNDWNTVVPDAAGVAPTAAEVVNEWETQSQADPTGFHVNVMEWLSSTASALETAASVNTAVENGQVGTDAAAAVADLANGTDGLGAIKADTAAVLLDTADIQPNYATEAKQDIIDTNIDNLNLGIIYGATEAGTLSTTVCTSDLTGYADDELIGRAIIFTGGDANGQASDITDYASTNGTVTYTAITTLPAAADTFKIV